MISAPKTLLFPKTLFIHESTQFPTYARNLAVSNNIIPSPAKAAILRAAAMSGVIRARGECRASPPDGSLGAKTSVADWPAEAWKADTRAKRQVPAGFTLLSMAFCLLVG